MILKFIDYGLLSDWEHDFIISLEKWYAEKGFLTDNQEEVLERIYKEKQ